MESPNHDSGSTFRSYGLKCQVEVDMRKWFVFGLLGAAVLTGFLVWYLWREDDDFQEFAGGVIGGLNRRVNGTRDKLAGAWQRIRGN